MAVRGLRSGTCQVCRHPERERIEALRASGASLDSLARKFKVDRDAVWRRLATPRLGRPQSPLLGRQATVAELREKAKLEGGRSSTTSWR